MQSLSIGTKVDDLDKTQWLAFYAIAELLLIISETMQGRDILIINHEQGILVANRNYAV